MWLLWINVYITIELVISILKPRGWLKPRRPRKGTWCLKTNKQKVFNPGISHNMYCLSVDFSWASTPSQISCMHIRMRLVCLSPFLSPFCWEGKRNVIYCVPFVSLVYFAYRLLLLSLAYLGLACEFNEIITHCDGHDCRMENVTTTYVPVHLNHFKVPTCAAKLSIWILLANMFLVQFWFL